MRRRIRVVVTAKDIAAVEYRHQYGYVDGKACPVARAVQRAGFPEAHVEAENWRPNGVALDVLPLPKSVAKWIKRYDAWEPVEPATFYLQGPDLA